MNRKVFIHGRSLAYALLLVTAVITAANVARDPATNTAYDGALLASNP